MFCICVGKGAKRLYSIRWGKCGACCREDGETTRIPDHVPKERIH